MKQRLERAHPHGYERRHALRRGRTDAVDRHGDVAADQPVAGEARGASVRMTAQTLQQRLRPLGCPGVRQRASHEADAVRRLP
jgi:hypothetical protein